MSGCSPRARRRPRATSGQVADERVRQRLARIPGLFLGLIVGFVAALGVLRFRLRGLVFGTDETALDPNIAIMADNDERAAARNVVWIEGMAFDVQPVDFGFELRKARIHLVRKVGIGVLPFRVRRSSSSCAAS